MEISDEEAIDEINKLNFGETVEERMHYQAHEALVNRYLALTNGSRDDKDSIEEWIGDRNDDGRFAELEQMSDDEFLADYNVYVQGE